MSRATKNLWDCAWNLMNIRDAAIADIDALAVRVEALEKMIPRGGAADVAISVSRPAPAEDLVKRLAKVICDFPCGKDDDEWDGVVPEDWEPMASAVLALLRSEGRLCEPGEVAKAQAEGWDSNVAASKEILVRAERAEAELAAERKAHEATKRQLARAWREAGIPDSGLATGCAPCRCGGFRQPGDPWVWAY